MMKLFCWVSKLVVYSLISVLAVGSVEIAFNRHVAVRVLGQVLNSVAAEVQELWNSDVTVDEKPRIVVGGVIADLVVDKVFQLLSGQGSCFLLKRRVDFHFSRIKCNTSRLLDSFPFGALLSSGHEGEIVGLSTCNSEGSSQGKFGEHFCFNLLL